MSAPKAATFPPGGVDTDSVTCTRCGDPATHSYEGAEFLNFCDGCFRKFGRWLDG